MRIDLPYCNFKNCKYQLDGNCTDQLMYERCEFNRMKDRLQIDPSGSDKTDELEEALENVRPERYSHWHEYLTNVFMGRFSKDGEPICQDRKTFMCVKCGRGSAIKEKFCPSCGAMMNGGA